MTTLNIYKLNENAHNLTYGTEQSACFDVSAFIQYQSQVKLFTTDNKVVESLATRNDEGNNYIELPPEWRALIPTGLIFDIPDNYCVKIYPRSGLSSKKGLNLINCVGIIDSDYVEQIFIPLYNNSQEKIRIYNGDRIAQGELVKFYKVQFDYIDKRPEKKTSRDGGFGSTSIEWIQLNNS